MTILVKLNGKADNVVFTHPYANLEKVANELELALSNSKGPLETAAKYYGRNSINLYPNTSELRAGDYLVNISNVNGMYTVSTETITGTTGLNAVRSKPLASFKSVTDFANSFKPQANFDVGGTYIFKYSGGTNPNADRFVKVDEVHADGILCKDLQKISINHPEGEIRKFLFCKITNIRKVG